MLVDFQNAFVRLVADADFRDRFVKNADETKGYDLSPRERRALVGIPEEQLARYASALLAKRSREFAGVLPLTLRLCPSLVDRYRRWLARHPSSRRATVLSPGLAEALRSLEPLRQEVMADPAEAPHAADVFAFETLANACRMDGEPRAWTCRYRTHELVRTLRSGAIPMDPDAAPTRYVFTREGFEYHSASGSDS